MTRLLVVGAGAAGIGAAFEAARRADVTVVHDRPGASALFSGALDSGPWEEETDEPLDPRTIEVVEGLGFRVPERGARIATVAGVLRSTRAHDASLLDLAAVRGRVLVPRVSRANWDADALAASWSEQAAGFDVAFEVADVPVLRRTAQTAASDLDLASAADDREHLEWLGGRLAQAVRASGASAVLLGPWLGLAGPRARELSAVVGVPCGEALVGAGSPAGARFEAARDALLARLGVRVVRATGTRLVPRDEGVALDLADGRRLEADAVVVAMGGLVGGGIRFSPPESTAGAGAPSAVGPSFVAALGGLPAPDLPHDGPAPLGVTSSLLGLALDGRTWPAGRGARSALEDVGLDARTLPAHVAAAGEALRGTPHAFLACVESGIRAARGLVNN